MAWAISTGANPSSSSARAASAAKRELSTLMAPVRGVVTRWPRQVNSVRPGSSTMSVASEWLTATMGMRARSRSRRPHASSASTTPRNAYPGVNSIAFASKYSSIVSW